MTESGNKNSDITGWIELCADVWCDYDGEYLHLSFFKCKWCYTHWNSKTH